LTTTRSGLRRSLRLGMDAAARRNPELSAVRRATASGSMRKRLTTLKATRSTGRFSPPNPKPVKRISKPPARGLQIKANAVPRPGDLRSAAVSLSRGRLPQGSLLNDIVTAIRQPLIRQFASAGGAHTAGLNIRTQMGLLQRQRLHAQRSANVRSASDNFLYGQRQTGRLTARRRGTPVRGGQPTRTPR